MHTKLAIPSLLLGILLHTAVIAQSVLYSPTVNDEENTSFDVIGKAGNYYWLYQVKKNFAYKNGRPIWPPKEEGSFEVYDGRLQKVTQIPAPLSDSVIKQYLIPQRYSFDQLVFKNAPNKTSVLVNHFSQDGAKAAKNVPLFDFPNEMALEDILVIRSPDRTKILLLGFVRTENITPDVYARVYTRDWELVHEIVYKKGNLLQPFIQYEYTEYPLESTDASPIKLTNSGDWLMVASERFKNNYVLCHFKQGDSTIAQMDIQQLSTTGVEYCSLSLEGESNVYIGTLENITNADKKVRIMQYDLAGARLAYDTSYGFHLPDAFKKREHYVAEEEFIHIPGKGFMYMKEYGRRYYVDLYGDQIMLDYEQQYPAYSNHASKLKFNENEYTRNTSLSDNKRLVRGDLSMKYFPFNAADTCWGGLLHVEQETELRPHNLSYACVPSGDKIIFLYNSLAKNDHKVSSTTILDHKGQPLDEGVIFWRSANVLNFQKARLIHPGELCVPFDRNGVQGFAVIRF